MTEFITDVFIILLFHYYRFITPPSTFLSMSVAHYLCKTLKTQNLIGVFYIYARFQYTSPGASFKLQVGNFNRISEIHCIEDSLI